MALCLEKSNLSKERIHLFHDTPTCSTWFAVDLFRRDDVPVAEYSPISLWWSSDKHFLCSSRNPVHIWECYEYEKRNACLCDSFNIITVERLVDFPLDRVDVGQRRQSRMIRSNGWMSGFDEQAFLSGLHRMDDWAVRGNARTTMYYMVRRAVHYYSMSSWMDEISLIWVNTVGKKNKP